MTQQVTQKSYVMLMKRCCNTTPHVTAADSICC